LMLVLAANQSKDWDEEEPVEDIKEDGYKTPWPEQVSPITVPTEPEEVVAEKEFDIKDHPYLFTPAGSQTPPGIDPVPIQVYKAEPSDDTLEPCYKCGTPLINAAGIGPFCPNKECDVSDSWALKDSEPIEITYIPPEPIVIEEPKKLVELPEMIQSNTIPYQELDGGYVMFDNKHMHKDVLLGMRPDILKLVADSGKETKTNFGTSFPAIASKGDTFVRVDSLPNKVYKFDGIRWININKNQSDSYLHDQEYIKYLVQKIEEGEYDIELLSEIEKQQIEDYLTKNS